MLGSAQFLAGGVSLCLVHLFSPLFHLHGVQDLSGFPLLAALTLALAYCLSPLLCSEARRDERDADEYALAVTGDVENYVSVMRKLRRMNLEERDYHPWSRFFFDTHPSYAERVHLAQQYRRRHPSRRKAPHWRGWRHIQRHGRR
jgi:Zn-dependent protease with chaperone function